MHTKVKLDSLRQSTSQLEWWDAGKRRQAVRHVSSITRKRQYIRLRNYNYKYNPNAYLCDIQALLGRWQKPTTVFSTAGPSSKRLAGGQAAKSKSVKVLLSRERHWYESHYFVSASYIHKQAMAHRQRGISTSAIFGQLKRAPATSIATYTTSAFSDSTLRTNYFAPLNASHHYLTFKDAQLYAPPT